LIGSLRRENSQSNRSITTLVIIPETSAQGGEPTIRRTTRDFSAKLQHAFDGLLGGVPLGSFEERPRKE